MSNVHVHVVGKGLKLLKQVIMQRACGLIWVLMQLTKEMVAMDTDAVIKGLNITTKCYLKVNQFVC